MLKQILFGENQKVMEIDIETLEKSADYRNPNEKKFPMSHIDVINEITEMLESKKIPYEFADIFITEKGTIPGTQKQVDRINKRILKDNPKAKEEELTKINDTSVTIIREVIGSIKLLGEYSNDEMGLIIGFNQNEKGFVFGIGTRVAICSNFTIMGADDVYKNYGKDSIPFEQIIELIEKRINNIKEFSKEQTLFIKNLMTMRVPAVQERNSILGDLLSLAVKSAYIDTSIESPLNISECSKLAANMLHYNDDGDKLVPLWDFFNNITAITSKSTRLEGRLLQSAATGKYFRERYRLDEIIDVVDLEEDNPSEEAKEILEKDDTPNTIEKEDKNDSSKPLIEENGEIFDTGTGEEI